MSKVIVVLLVFFGLGFAFKFFRRSASPVREQTLGTLSTNDWVNSSGPVADSAKMDELNRDSRLKRVELLTRF